MGSRVIAVVDPGTTTGVLVGLIESRLRPTEGLANGLESGFVETFEVDTRRWWEPDLCDELQNRISSQVGDDWVNVDIVFEDFILRTADKRKTTLDPIRVTSATVARLMERGWQGKPVLQQPSQAKTIATNERLRKWGLWIVGSAHERDAMRHAVVYLRST